MSRPTSGGRGALVDLERYLVAAGRRRLGLSEMERESLAQGREIARRSLQAHIDERANAEVGAAMIVDDPAGPVRLAYRRWHTRRIVTMVGGLAVTRIGYRAPGRPSIHPLDADLQLPGRSFSYEVQRHLARAAVCGPFDEAVHVLAEMTGARIPKRSAEQVVIDAAADVDSFYEQRTGATGALGRRDIVVGAIDCKGIPMVKPEPARRVVRRKKGEKPQKKKMATVAAVLASAPRRRTPDAVLESLFCEYTATRPCNRRQRPKDKRVWASLSAGKDNFIADVHAEMTRRSARVSPSWWRRCRGLPAIDWWSWEADPVTRDQVLELCLGLSGAVEDYPFGDEVAVFKVGGKMFALVMLAGEPGSVTLKCDPAWAVELRDMYTAVRPGYHTNKRHWNTVDLDGSVDHSELRAMIEHSYELVVSRLPRRERERLRER